MAQEQTELTPADYGRILFDKSPRSAKSADAASSEQTAQSDASKLYADGRREREQKAEQADGRDWKRFSPFATDESEEQPQKAAAGADASKSTETKPGADYVVNAGDGGDAEIAKGYAKTARELGVDVKTAQALFDKMGPQLAARQQEQHTALAARWAKETQADPDIGGANLTATIERAGAVLRAYGDSDLRKLLIDSRLANHPGVLRFLNRVATELAL